MRLQRAAGFHWAGLPACLCPDSGQFLRQPPCPCVEGGSWALWEDRGPRTEPWGMRNSWPWEQVPLLISPPCQEVHSGDCFGSHPPSREGCPRGSLGPGRESGLSRMTGTMFPKTQPEMLPIAWGQRLCEQWQGSRHARSKLGPLGAPVLCPGSCCQHSHPSIPGQQQWLPGPGRMWLLQGPASLPRTARPRLNGALCSQQSHLSPPPAPLPSWGHSVAFIPAWPKALSWEGVSQ